MYGFEFTNWQVGGLIIDVIANIALGYFILDIALKYIYPLEEGKTDDEEEDYERVVKMVMKRILWIEIWTGAAYSLVFAPAFTGFITICILFSTETPLKVNLFTVFISFFGTMLGFFFRQQELQFHWLAKIRPKKSKLRRMDGPYTCKPKLRVVRDSDDHDQDEGA